MGRPCRRLQRLGKLTVSVLDRVGPVDRNGIKVSDELEIMARNEAAGLGADTIRPLGEPHDGAQSWGAYSCGASCACRCDATAMRRHLRATPWPSCQGT